jgi:hypothetical protein
VFQTPLTVGKPPPDRRLGATSAAVAALVGLVMGWLAVPNAMIPYDTLDARVRLAIAAGLAAGPGGYVLARRVTTHPWNAGLRIMIGTYVAGMLTILVCGVPFEALAVGAAPRPMSGTGFWLSLIPWIVLGGLIWAAVMTIVRHRDQFLGRSWRSIAGDVEARKAPAALGIALIVTILAGLVGVPDVRHLGWSVPAEPTAHRPSSAGAVVSVSGDSANGLTVQLEGGRSVVLDRSGNLGQEAGQKGDLLVYGSGDHPWYTFIPNFGGPTAAPGNWFIESQQFAWDRGGSILLPNGLELPKAASFHTNYATDAVFSERIYELEDASRFLINGQGQITGLVTKDG